MAQDDPQTPVSLASTACALWALNHETDPAFFAMAPGRERAEYEAMAARFLQLARVEPTAAG